MGSGSLKGRLGEFSLADLVQLIGMGGKTGLLSLGSGTRTDGSMYFEFGYVVHASFQGLEGEEAACLMLAAEGGQFEFSPGRTPARKSLMMAGHELLMRAAQNADEAAFLKDAGQLMLKLEEHDGDDPLDVAGERIRELLLTRLGRRSRKPLAALDDRFETLEDLRSACKRIERFIALFIDEKKAEAVGREMEKITDEI